MEISRLDHSELRKLEESLWMAETRFRKEYMEEVLAPGFFEFGRSGKKYSRQEIIDYGYEGEIPVKTPFRNFEVTPISEGVVLVTYVSEVRFETLEVSNRSSLWHKASRGWKLAFHQGTPTAYIAEAIAAVTDLNQGLLDKSAYGRTAKEQLRLLADRLAQGHAQRHPGAYFELSNWLPALVGKSIEAVWAADLVEADYSTAIAREHGYQGWSDVASEPENRPSREFENLVDAALDGDEATLGQMLAARPELANARSHWRHRAAPLHYMAANGVETHRQRVPANAARIVEILIRHGADVNARADMYGGDQTVLGLLVSSQHPAEAGVLPEIKRLLLDAGAME